MLSEALLRRLEAFALSLRNRSSGGLGGLRRSHSFGASVEFSDFRDYAPGDDLRRLDWNAYARFDRLFLKLFLEEQQSCLRLFLDASGSMNTGEPDKWAVACQLAAMLGYLSLLRYDRVTVYSLTGGGCARSAGFMGRQSYPQLIAYLSQIKPQGATHISQALTRAPVEGPRGLSVLISDLLDENGVSKGLASLAYRKQEVAVLQLLSPEELAPSLSGALRLTDPEGSPACEVHISPDSLRGYHQALDAFLREQKSLCHRYGFLYALLGSDINLEREALDTLMRQGVIAPR